MMSIWQDLQERQNAVADRKITALFDDPNRAEDFSLRTQHMLFDYAKTNIDADARAALLQLVENAKVTERRDAMFAQP